MGKHIAVILTAVGILACAVFVVDYHTKRNSVLDNDLHVAAGANSAPVPLGQVDHSVWDELLRKYVDADGMVDYASWKASKRDRARLRQYLAILSQADVHGQATKQDRIAFWVNAYNALTIYGILDVYPTPSIRKHTSVIFGYNIWKDLLLPVSGQKYSLNDMEHKVLRKLGEPRIHFAIVCASIGCPRLRNHAYTAARVEQQLADNTHDFFGRAKHFQVDLPHRRVYVSAIFKWFGGDFAPTPQKALARLAPYVPVGPVRKLLESEDFTVSFLPYNWDLNNQGTTKQGR